MQLDRELVAASTTPIILSILEHKGEELSDGYGYAIIKEVARLSGDSLNWTEGMLYPVLHRLERNGFISSRWERSETGRRRKHYRITANGHDELERLKSQWDVVDTILRSSWRDK